MAKEKQGTEIALPFTSTAVAVAEREFSGTPYVQFAHHSSPSWTKILSAIPDVEDGDPVLARDGAFTALSPLRFMLLAAQQFWCQMDGVGAVVRASRDRSPGYKELIETSILVVVGTELVAARCTFKTTKCPAVHSACDALKLAADKDEWAKKSPEHKASLAAPVSWARFSVHVRMVPKSAQSGNAYQMADGIVKPTTNADWTMISAYLNDEECMTALRAVADDYKKRLEYLEGKR